MIVEKVYSGPIVKSYTVQAFWYSDITSNGNRFSNSNEKGNKIGNAENKMKSNSQIKTIIN